MTGSDQVFGESIDVTPRQDVLGSIFSLTGSQLSSTDLQPGGNLRVELVWKAIRRPLVDYTVFVHILDAADHVIAQADSMPLNGSFLTSDWDVGDTIFDSRDIPLPKDLKPGTYSVEVGLYDAASGSRLSTATGDTPVRFGSLVLADL